MAVAAHTRPVGGTRSRARQFWTCLLIAAVLGLLAWGIGQVKLGGGAAPKRQTVKITLPDSLPPPPPPKPEDKRPEPKEDNKPAPQMEPKPVEAPAQAVQSLKMEGAAGDGPSAFSSGSVGKDYNGGNVVSGGNAGGGGTGSDRAKYQFYVNSAKQLLKDEIERHLQSDEKQLVVTFSLWVKPDGSVDRCELMPTGNEHADTELKAAFAQMAKGTQLPPPRDTPQPLRMRMTLLPLAS